LALKDGQRITPEMIEYLKDMEKAKVDMEKVLLLVKDMTPQQESALAEIKKTAALENELKNYLSSKKIEEEVTIEAGMNAAIITPRAPLLFSEGEVWLKPEGVEIVDKIAQLIKELPYYEISIAGHTDPKPIDPFHRYKFDSNWELSYGRAIAIAKRFIAKGVPPQRLSVAGYAQYKPRYPNDTKENRAKNRRVEIYISFSKETNNKKI
jgi:chemotaxis protein MotB